MNDTYLAWLNDARAMELGMVETLQSHIKLADGKNDKLKKQLEKHLRETEEQAEMVTEAIERYGGKVSHGKGMISKIASSMAGTTAALSGDDLMKASLSDYAAEHLEIASYTAIATAAEDLGDLETIKMCDKILEQERAMAAWLEANLPELASTYIQKEEEQEMKAEG